MNETPITVLEKKIKFYNDFIVILQNKDGIDKNAPQEKLDGIVMDCRDKIAQFEAALDILKISKNKWENKKIVRMK